MGGRGSAPDPAGGAYRAPRPLARFYGGEEGERMGRKGGQGWGGRGKGRTEGRGG